MQLVAKFQKILFIFLLVLNLSSAAQNQAELNDEAFKSYKKADKELNRIYQQVLTEYGSLDSLFVRNLKTSQRIWIIFRYLEVKVKYPETDPATYGSSYSMCLSIYIENLTRDRIKTLKVWLDGIKDGEVCSGSVKII